MHVDIDLHQHLTHHQRFMFESLPRKVAHFSGQGFNFVTALNICPLLLASIDILIE